MATVLADKKTAAGAGLTNAGPIEGPSFVDLFAGCGGLSLGLEFAGFIPLYVNELDDSARATYIANRVARFPHLGLPERQSGDIFTVTCDDGSLVETARELQIAAARLGTSSNGPRRSPQVDLVVGGPPCQGYSRIGHRRTFRGFRRADVPSNHLFEQMARFIEALRPRMFLFENVRGLKSGRWTPDGEKGEIWRSVFARFASIEGYRVRDAEVLAKNYGVPQNRPRVLIVGIRDDVPWQPNGDLMAEGLLPESGNETAWHPVEFLGDLIDPSYPDTLETTSYLTEATTPAQRWLRSDLTGAVASAGHPLTDHRYSRHNERIRAKFAYMIANHGEIRLEDRTKKFTQRLIPWRWGARGPTITATSLPDDYVHFSQPRVLTVREWARLQTFPDWYRFMGKRTTGGRRRAGNPDAGDWSRELPKYTQIGNAVPVRLAEAIGRHLKGLLS
jgi:DNA (cytosine-5)-methyltransferase 1